MSDFAPDLRRDGSRHAGTLRPRSPSFGDCCPDVRHIDSRHPDSRHDAGLEADADEAFALFDLAAPDLPTPHAIRRELPFHADIAVWTLEAKGGVLRMKVASSPAATERLRRGAALLRALAKEGLRVPEPLRLSERTGRARVAVALERRLGTTHAFAGWPILGTSGRVALARSLATSLLALHRLPASRWGSLVAPDSNAPLTERGREELQDRVDRRVRALVELDVLASTDVAPIRDRLRFAASALPTHVTTSLCHGRPLLTSLALERRELVGMCDFELAQEADRWTDVAAARMALGDPSGAPASAFLDAYVTGVDVAERPPDLESRLDFYLGGLTLATLESMARYHPDEARLVARDWASRWSSHASGSRA